MAYSFVTAEGLSALRARVVEMLGAQQERQSQGYFRLPVDRSFVLRGHGLIVTGTALSGEVHAGDRVRSLPRDLLFRVRSIEVHGERVAVATHGQRVALNLSGHEGTSIHRGDVICHEQLTLTSTLFDAYVDIRSCVTSGVKSHQRVRVYIGTSERIGRLIVLGVQDTIGAKQRAYCQIVLSEPVFLLRGDRFIIRDETGQQTLAGGVVINPWAQKHRRNEPDLERKLAVIHRGNPADALETYIGDSRDFAVPLAHVKQFLNLREEEVDERVAHAPGIKTFHLEEERLYTTDTRLRELRNEVLEALRDYHRRHPLAPGMDIEELRGMLHHQLTPRLFRAFVELLETDRALVREASVLRLPTHEPRLSARERQLADRIVALLGADSFAPPDLKQIEASTGYGRREMLPVLAVMEQERAIVRVAPELYFLADAVVSIKTTVYQYLTGQQGDLAPAAFRDLIGTSRKYAIPLLEFLDREGLTIRVGNGRRLKSRL